MKPTNSQRMNHLRLNDTPWIINQIICSISYKWALLQPAIMLRKCDQKIPHQLLYFMFTDFWPSYQSLSWCPKNRKLSKICLWNIRRDQTARDNRLGWLNRWTRTKLFEFTWKRWRMGNLQGDFENSQCREPNQMVGPSGQPWWVQSGDFLEKFSYN